LDDAGVYLIRKNLSLVHTVDFFTPVVDDAYDFGAIAAANALSDIYAMGARPVTALCIVCFPLGEMDLGILKQMLRGGIDKLREAGAELLGGHSVKDKELKFGFAVTGTADPSRLVLKSGARIGDVLVLTKPLGIGVLSTALKAGLLTKRREREMTEQMSALNHAASRVMIKVGVNACTDVTGFGLLGHAYEMAVSSGRTLRIDSSSVPFLSGVFSFIRKGVFPGGLSSVREFLEGKMRIEKGVSDEAVHGMCDPQTSGGLLICVPEKKAKALVRGIMRGAGGKATIVGRVMSREKVPLVVC
jgi:selenide, water dikinase